ncbi:hypothetical protein [Synechococcus elongatus]|uniref:Uncharacterized protein n=1 Tax=Synechococcus elongatus PCC 11801 TaxID=2219813 RepID=A0AAN1UTN0_SYNEL|nr:hypothetical protein [Synechococcus elongatus]AZB71673.1 hypothetical protein DOP62_02110 [Synechococcus elongatus PCC 11801]
MKRDRLPALLAWIAAKCAEELDVRLLATPTEELWGRHIIWLFLLTRSEQEDPSDRQAVNDFLAELADEEMAAARQIFFQIVEQRRAANPVASTPDLG